MTRDEATSKLLFDHTRLLQALNLFSATIEFSPVWVDRRDGRGLVRSPNLMTGEPGGMLFGMMIKAPSEKLRDIAKSLVYRFESQLYHLTLILDLQDEYESIISLSPISQQSQARLWTLHYHAHFLFDDILFNLCSLLDYLGALLLGVLLKQTRLLPGEDGIDESRFDWGVLSIFSTAPSPKSRIDPNLSSLSMKILEHDKDYVRKLFNYRNKVIHLYVRPSSPDLSKQRILIPNSFVSEVGFGSLSGKHNQTNLTEGCIDIIHRVTTTVVDVMECARTCLLEGQI